MFTFSENIASLPELSPPNLLIELYNAYLPTQQIAPDGQLGILSDRIGTRKALRDQGIYYATPDNYQQILESVYGPYTMTAWLINYIYYLWREVLHLPVSNASSPILQVVAGYGDGSFITGHPAAILCLQLLLKSMHRPVPVRSIAGIGNLDWKMQSVAWGTHAIPYIDFTAEFVATLSQIHQGNIVGLTSSLKPVADALAAAGVLQADIPVKDLWSNVKETSQEIPAIDRVDGHIEQTISCVIADDQQTDLAWRITSEMQRLHIEYQVCLDHYKSWQWLTIFAGERIYDLQASIVEIINQQIQLGNKSLVGMSLGYSVVPHLDGFQLSSFDPIASVRMEEQIQAMRSERSITDPGQLYICTEP